MKIDSSNYMFTAVLSQSSIAETTRKPLGIERSSGHQCPQSGYWQLANPAMSVVVNVKKGENMPFQQGVPVNWQLIEYDLTNEVDI
jgi:hypothetical protein